MNEHEPRIGDVILEHGESTGVILEVIYYPRGTGDRGHVLFHWFQNTNSTLDFHPLSLVRSVLANGDMKLVSRAESVNFEKV
jgi:hypothetical protein